MKRTVMHFLPKGRLSQVKQQPLFPGMHKYVKAFDGDYQFDYGKHTWQLLSDAKLWFAPIALALPLGASYFGFSFLSAPLHQAMYIASSILLLRFLARGPSNKIKKDLTGRVAVVSGGLGGIGREVTLQLAEMGATIIVLCKKNDAKEKELMSRLNSIGIKEKDIAPFLKGFEEGKRVYLAQIDLRDLSNIRDFGRLYDERFSHCDILVHCAGVMHPKEVRNQYGDEEQVSINLLGPYVLSETLLPSVAAEKGRIVFVCSSAHNTISSAVAKTYFVSSSAHWSKEKRKSFDGFEQYAFTKLGNIFNAQDLAARSYMQSTINAKGAFKDAQTSLQKRQRLTAAGFKNGSDANSEKETKEPLFTVVCANPGGVITPLFRSIPYAVLLYYWGYYFFLLLMKSPREGSQTVINCCLRDDIVNGGYYQDCKYKPEGLSMVACSLKERQLMIGALKKRVDGIIDRPSSRR